MKNDKAMNIMLNAELKEKAQKCAKEKNISLNSLVRLILSEYLQKQN